VMRSEVIPLLQSTKDLPYTAECKRKHVESGGGCETAVRGRKVVRLTNIPMT
jgi:hypothetical protein